MRFDMHKSGFSLGFSLLPCFAVLLVLCAFVIPASDEDESAEQGEENDLTFFFYGSEKAQYTDDSISNTTKFENEIALNAGYGAFSLYFRVSNDLSFPNQKKDTEIEKVTLKYAADKYTLTAGDLSAIFGKGLTLNIFEASAVDYDTEIRGGMVEVEVGSAMITLLKGGFDGANKSPSDGVSGIRTAF